MLDGILQGFLQYPEETKRNLAWQFFWDVLRVKVNFHPVPFGQLSAKASRSCCKPQVFQLRGVKMM
jgi:hypothetical protein